MVTSCSHLLFQSVHESWMLQHGILYHNQGKVKVVVHCWNSDSLYDGKPKINNNTKISTRNSHAKVKLFSDVLNRNGQLECGKIFIMI